MWFQKTIELSPKPRGFHLINEELFSQLPELARVQTGLLQVFLQHTSAALTLNENADPSVRADFTQFFDRLVPECQPYYTHTQEGDDDLPAHLKSSLLGVSVLLPVSAGRVNLGLWQGIYLCEFRNELQRRRVVITLQGEG